MDQYTFTWEHTAKEVYVTGTFDDWRKTVKLEEKSGIFQKTVYLPKVHTQYKFVVDGNWCVNDSARKEDDGHGITNNVLLPDDFSQEHVSLLSSAAPASTTTALAGAIPKMDRTVSSLEFPGAFPMTPAAETPGSEPQTFNIAPIPATAGLGNPIKLAPGEPVPHPSTFTDNTVHSTVQHGEAPKEASILGVAPIPATPGAGNPIHLEPGDKVPDPSTLTPHTLQSTVKTDHASYEASDALPPLAFTPEVERNAKGGMFNLPPFGPSIIPESSLPMGADAKVEKDTGITLQSAAPTSSTAALAAQVPLEPRSSPRDAGTTIQSAGPTSTTSALAGAVPLESHAVPETVIESQEKAGADPEASANPEAVEEKREVEEELKARVPETPVAADNSFASTVTANAQAGAAAAAAGITAGAGLLAGALYAAKDKVTETTGLNGSATTSHPKQKAAETVGLSDSTPAGDVPVRVVESQKEAHVSPEASANPEAVHEKSQVEQELLSEVHKTTESGSAAPAVVVPDVVTESRKAAHVSPEAAANSEAVAEKRAVEAELLSEIPKTNQAGEPAPVLTAATTEFAPGAKSASATPGVPQVVAESQHAAHASPEAAANLEAVIEKKAVEAELLKEIKPTESTGAPAPAIATPSPAIATPSPAIATPSPAIAAPAPAIATPAPAIATPAATTFATTATTITPPIIALDSKSATSTDGAYGLNAPASTPAVPPTSKPVESTTEPTKAGSTTTNQDKPTVTTGVDTTTTAPKSTALETPVKSSRADADSDISPKGTPGGSMASGIDDKKKKRRSIFGKLKDKLSSKLEK